MPVTFNRYDTQQNYLLASLPSEVFERIAPHMQRISVKAGQNMRVFESKEPVIYFPTTAILSVYYMMEHGASVEIVGVGNEGMLGGTFFMGGIDMISLVTVHATGACCQVNGQILMQEFKRCGAFMHMVMRYTHAFISQVSQSAGCNRHHSVEQRLCRLLLMSIDRLSSNELNITQELIASMLGVRREGVTKAACNLHRCGIIDYHRGHITVVDRQGLESHVCECYNVVRNELHHMLGHKGSILTLRYIGSVGLRRLIANARRYRRCPASGHTLY